MPMLVTCAHQIVPSECAYCELVKLRTQRDALVVELLALRAAINDLGIQDADDFWYAALSRADAFMDALIDSSRRVSQVGVRQG